jgi:hypothetical protein
MKTKTLLILDRLLALISLAAIILSHLALTDIAHGEPDLRLEWTILRLTAGLLLIFIIFTLLLVGHFKRNDRIQSTMLEAIHKRELRIWMKRRGLNPRSFRPLVWYPRSEAATRNIAQGCDV